MIGCKSTAQYNNTNGRGLLDKQNSKNQYIYKVVLDQALSLLCILAWRLLEFY